MGEFNRIHPITDWAVVQYPRGQPYMITNGSDLGADSHATLGYGFVAIENQFGSFTQNGHEVQVNYTIATDGMNEKGLTVATQSLYRSQYPMWDGQPLNQIGFYAYRTHSDMQWQFINVSALNFGG